MELNEFYSGLAKPVWLLNNQQQGEVHILGNSRLE
jgi:hypothetical protein